MSELETLYSQFKHTLLKCYPRPNECRTAEEIEKEHEYLTDEAIRLGRQLPHLNGLNAEEKSPLMIVCDCPCPLNRLFDFLTADPKRIDIRQEMPSTGYTALLFAAGQGHLAYVKRLCEKGARVNKQTRLVGYTPLMTALINEQPDVALYLLKRRDIDLSLRLFMNAADEPASALEIAYDKMFVCKDELKRKMKNVYQIIKGAAALKKKPRPIKRAVFARSTAKQRED